MTDTNTIFDKLTKLQLINNNEWLCSDYQALFSWNRAAVFNLGFLFSPMHTATPTCTHWGVTVFVYKNMCTQLSSDHGVCDPENGVNHWNLALSHVLPTVLFYKHVHPMEPLVPAASIAASSSLESSHPSFHLCLLLLLDFWISHHITWLVIFYH